MSWNLDLSREKTVDCRDGTEGASVQPGVQ
jgi:hypothetical protein